MDPKANKHVESIDGYPEFQKWDRLVSKAFNDITPAKVTSIFDDFTDKYKDIVKATYRFFISEHCMAYKKGRKYISRYLNNPEYKTLVNTMEDFGTTVTGGNMLGCIQWRFNMICLVKMSKGLRDILKDDVRLKEMNTRLKAETEGEYDHIWQLFQDGMSKQTCCIRSR